MNPGQFKEPIAGFGQWHSAPQVNERGSYQYALDLIRESVVFLYTDQGGVRMTPHGTGFLIDVPSKTLRNMSYTYLITARHLVDADWTGNSQVPDQLQIRMNRQGPLVLEIGEPATVFYPLREQVWFHPAADSIDIAFTRVPKENLIELGAGVSPLGSDALASQIEADSMRIGDATVSAGLLSGVSGNLANYPIFKWGNISSFNSEPIPTKMPNGKTVNLFEALVSSSLVQGNSGSPVFILPNERHPNRMFLAGVQSMSYRGNDVAGMAPIRSLIDSLRKLDSEQSDIDFGPPDIPPVLSSRP